MAQLYDYPDLIIQEVKKAVLGKDAAIRKILMAILAKGHILIEDIPGVGKTTLAMAFSKAMGLEVNRMQFTPDVLPGDVTGFYMYDQDTKEFHYHPGPILCNLFLADEINRTSPKTQSALLEVMEERQITLDGKTIPVPEPFIVLSTQNPAGSAGTQMLPESQVDRFMISLHLGYPDLSSEISMVKDRHTRNPLADIQPVIQASQLLEMQALTERVFIHTTLYTYMAQLIAETRQHELIQLGASPRGTLSLSRMSQSCAFLAGRDYVIPEDVATVWHEVTEHRLILHPKAAISQTTRTAILEQILNSVPVPKP